MTIDEYSPITWFVRTVFGAAKWVSPLSVLRPFSPLFRHRSELTPEEVRDPDFTRRRSRAIELYMVAWFLVEAAAVILVCRSGLNSPVRFILYAAMTLKIIEVLQTTVNTVVFDALSGRPDSQIAGATRVLVLGFINFIELALCFGVIYALRLRELSGASTALDAFYFSVIT
jgi:hypothetical protein